MIMELKFNIITFFSFCLLSGLLFSQDLTIIAMEDVHQAAGNGVDTRTIETIVQFPDNSDDYSQIIMNIHLNCPAGGCDPWDRKAFISIENFERWVEIGRYVTPYGVSCGWTLDVTDFKSILKGEVNLKSHIDTWVNPGWLVNISFGYYEGESDHSFAQVRNVWNRGQVIYGDPTQPVDIAAVSEYIYSDVEEVKLKIITTGHGQGNTDNAAEFSNKMHQILLDDSFTTDHNFWRNDCAQNECSPQNGTWQYARAGFCPGDVAPPIEFDITSFVTPGSVLTLEYVLEDYFNYCSPNNPGCVNGQNGCSTCNYNNSSHTEPFYFIASQLIQYSENYHTNADVLLALLDLDPINQTVSIYMENSVPVYGIQFNFDTQGLDAIEPPYNYDLIFGEAFGGRADSAGWIVETNESGTVIGLSLSGENILPGEGILTSIYWSVESNLPLVGMLGIDVVEISGYFGESLKVEKGDPLSISILDLTDIAVLSERVELYNPYPNPFNPITEIKMFIPSFVEQPELQIFDLNGNLVHTYKQDFQSGMNNIKWDAENYASGIYFFKLNSANYTADKKVVLIK